jgi:hypothetical protein
MTIALVLPSKIPPFGFNYLNNIFPVRNHAQKLKRIITDGPVSVGNISRDEYHIVFADFKDFITNTDFSPAA